MNQYRKHLWSPDMEATYLSRSISKMLEAEEPVGDPFGGAAYGRFEIKRFVKKAVGAVVSPIAKAVGSDGVKVLALAGAVFTGGASLAAFSASTLTFSSIAAGVAYAGATLSLVGTATGNQKLSKLGNTVALVGGVAAVASGGLAALEEPMTKTLESAKEYYSKFVGSEAVNAGASAPQSTGALTSEQIGNTAVQNTASSVPSPATDALSSTKPVINQIGGAAPSTAASGTTVTPEWALRSSGVGAESGGLIESAKAAGNGLLDFAQKNPTIAFMAGNTAVSAIGGAAEARAKEESEAKARQQALDDRQFYNDSVKGSLVNYDYSTVQSPYGNAPVNPGVLQSPVVFDPQTRQYVPVSQPQRPGLIANTMPQRTA